MEDMTCNVKIEDQYVEETDELKIEFRGKKFECRRSYLTELLDRGKTKEIAFARVLHNVLILAGIVIIVSSIIDEYVYEKIITFGLGPPIVALKNFHLAFAIWLVMMAAVFLNFLGFHFWAWGSKALLKGEKYTRWKLWNSTWIFLLLVFYIGLVCFPLYSLRLVSFGFFTKMSLTVEQVRLAMKVHSYIAVNASKYVGVKNENLNTDVDTISNLFWKFLYFLFAPTLLYRDEYPRTPKINWKFLFGSCLEYAFLLYTLLFIYTQNFIDRYKDYGKVHFPWPVIVSHFFQTAVPSYLIFVLIFYEFLHVWFNIWAEFLRFGDRKFYKDWWSTRNLSTYFPKWNYVVHDWLVAYVYADLTQSSRFCTNNKMLAKFLVIFLSAVFHQYILSVSFGSLLPVQFICFAGGGLISCLYMGKISTNIGNFVLHMGILFGITVINNVHSMEYYARINCPSQYEDAVMDFIVPRFLACTFKNVTAQQM